MTSDETGRQTGENGNNTTPCPLFGCKRMYADASALESHIEEHEIPAQSVPGKILLCSIVGCSGAFPNMQKLMEHMRYHHKPNIFFLCESCRTKLRSYRGLLTHLHTCSKVPRGKAKPPEQTDAQPAMTNLNMAAMDRKLPCQYSVSSPKQLPSLSPSQEGSFPTAVPQPDFACPLLSPPFLSHPDSLPLQQVPGASSRTVFVNGPSNVHPPSNMDGHTSVAMAPCDAQGQKETLNKSLENVHSAPILTLHSPSGSLAIWKKNQAMACNRRILWEHTKGRYTCVQCGHSTTNRKEITQHINNQHSENKPVEASESSASST